MTSPISGAGWRQGRSQLPLALPDFKPLTDAGHLSADLPGKCRGDLVMGAEVHVIRPLDRAEIDQVLTQPGGTSAQHRPGQGELAGLLFADDGVPLADLKQSPEHLH
jgi:hypothetical protein